uniref:Uncharacterized protein n=1 Tax=Solanum lycopersicum TaxID=4081 RepID=A0A3Q7IXC9_SOLLC
MKIDQFQQLGLSWKMLIKLNYLLRMQSDINEPRREKEHNKMSEDEDGKKKKLGRINSVHIIDLCIANDPDFISANYLMCYCLFTYRTMTGSG